MALSTVSGPFRSLAGFIGDFVGSLTGNVTGNVTNTAVTYIADGAIVPTESFVELDATSADTIMTIAAPVAGQQMVIACVDATNTVTVTLTAGTFDGALTVATFDAAEETLVLYGISATRYVVVANIGTVVLS